MTTIVNATGAVRTSLVSIIKRQMIDTIIESNVDPSNFDDVLSALRKANFGEPAIAALAAEVAQAAQEEIGAGQAQ
ncbi:hypothetical protein QYR01_24190 [Brucella anthropi]|uniref:hypothetical protein n=1 Tax=Brucella anthropi TaxID=529 RepID=UPI0026726604|nr:hypothetical protein [Brucella anthropi]WKT94503.1 hypothetical protein QYR01_24190 [Brucella anthropi]